MRFSTICVFCRKATLAQRAAEKWEQDWERLPVEVQEKKCVRCKMKYKWWWFQKEPLWYKGGDTK